MQKRKVCASTVYARALLLKKIAVWMCSRQSRLTQKYITPDTLPAWPLIAHHCSSKHGRTQARPPIASTAWNRRPQVDD